MRETDIARIAHSVERTYLRTVGNFSIRHWDGLTTEHKLWRMASVRRLIENPEDAASATHNAWLVERLKEGWVRGDIENSAAKTHPNIALFNCLSEEDKLKDRIFYSVVLALLSEM